MAQLWTWPGARARHGQQACPCLDARLYNVQQATAWPDTWVRNVQQATVWPDTRVYNNQQPIAWPVPGYIASSFILCAKIHVEVSDVTG